MFERRRLGSWGLVIGLIFCVSIWRISVQEPSMLAAEFGYGNSGNGVNNMPPSAAYYQQQQQQQQQQQHLYGGKHLLARKSNDISEAAAPAAPAPATNESHKNTDTASSESNMAEQTQAAETHANTHQKYKLRLTPSYAAAAAAAAAATSRGAGVYNSTTKINNHTSYINILSSSNSISSSSGSSLQRARTSNFTETSGGVYEQHNSTSAAPWLEAAPVTPADRRHHTLSAPTITLPADDYAQLIDLHNFDYIMRQPACAADIYALILVHSAPHNFKKRLLIRDTWGSLATAPPLRLIFLLGAVVGNETLQHELREENVLYDDMVQGNFVDEYKNMTYKHVMAFKWFIYNCAHAQILIKVDDDVFFNTPQLLQLYRDNETLRTQPQTLRPHHQHQLIVTTASSTTSDATNTAAPPALQLQELLREPQHLLLCQQLLESRVKRSYRSKWRVSVREYAGRFYPPYCPGYSIMYSSDIVRQLYSAAQNTKYFWIDDVHVTGTLAQRTNITITPSYAFLLNRTACDQLLSGQTDLQDVEFLFAFPEISEQQIRDLWQLSWLQYASRHPKITQLAVEHPDPVAPQYIYEGFR